MVPPITNIDGNFAKLGLNDLISIRKKQRILNNDTESYLENGVAQIALHIVGRFIKVPNARDVILAAFAHHATTVGDNDASIPQCLSVIVIPFKN